MTKEDNSVHEKSNRVEISEIESRLNLAVIVLKVVQFSQKVQVINWYSLDMAPH